MVCGLSTPAYRPALKNHRWSFAIGPPKVPSYVCWLMLGRVMLRDFSNGVSSVHAGLRRLTRPLPENLLPPLFVIAFTTPPLKRPYSAEMPDVRTGVSATTCTVSARPAARIVTF